MSRERMQHAVSRPPGRELDETASCDFFSYAYLSLAFFLFLCGSGLTFLVLRTDPTTQGPLNRFWMAGPLFICTGLLVALKVLLYVRRKRLIALLIREMTREQNWPQDPTQSQAIIFERCSLSSIVSLPPPYDVATQSLPPSYDEALAIKTPAATAQPAARSSSKNR